MSQRLPQLVFACYLFATVAQAQDGLLDTSFSGDGIVQSNFGTGFEAAFTVVALPDGAVLAGGVAEDGSNFDMQVIRYHASGLVDGSWGNFGGQTLAIDRVANGWDDVLAIVPDPSGAATLLGSAEEAGVFLGGSSVSFPVLVRLTAGGDLDGGFGNGGIVTPPTHPWDGTIDVLDASAHFDGFLFFGTCSGCGTGGSLAYFLYRTLASGAPDTGFDSDGWLLLDDSGLGQLDTFAVDPAGRILLAGDAVELGGEPELRLHRRLANGGPDLSFAGNGTAAHFFADNVQWTPRGIAFDPVDGAVIVGLQRNAGIENAAGSLVRFSVAGAFDGTFGQPLLTYLDGVFVHELAIDGSGRIFVGGSYEGVGDQPGGFYFARRLRTGGADSTFDSNGIQAVEIDAVENGWDQGFALTLSGGRPLAAGHSETQSGGQRFALVRLTNALIFADGFDLGTTWAW